MSIPGLFLQSSIYLESLKGKGQASIPCSYTEKDPRPALGTGEQRGTLRGPESHRQITTQVQGAVMGLDRPRVGE